MLDTLTLLVVLITSNLLMAGAMWITFAGRFRAIGYQLRFSRGP